MNTIAYQFKMNTWTSLQMFRRKIPDKDQGNGKYEATA